MKEAILTGVKLSEDKVIMQAYFVRLFYAEKRKEQQKDGVSNQKTQRNRRKLPKEIYKWHTVEKIARNVAEAYGCKEIRTLRLNTPSFSSEE